jgi:hypothetical protein
LKPLWNVNHPVESLFQVGLEARGGAGPLQNEARLAAAWRALGLTSREEPGVLLPPRQWGAAEAHAFLVHAGEASRVAGCCERAGHWRTAARLDAARAEAATGATRVQRKDFDIQVFGIGFLLSKTH